MSYYCKTIVFTLTSDSFKLYLNCSSISIAISSITGTLSSGMSSRPNWISETGDLNQESRSNYSEGIMQRQSVKLTRVKPVSNESDSYFRLTVSSQVSRVEKNPCLVSPKWPKRLQIQPKNNILWQINLLFSFFPSLKNTPSLLKINQCE